MAHDVFISYSSKDKVIADAVCAKLENNNIRCWIAPRDILPGKIYAESIIDALNACNIFILILSSNSNKSNQVIREVENAVSKGSNILTFRIEEFELSKSLKYFVGSTHWLDALTIPMEKHINELIKVVQALLNVKRSFEESKSEESIVKEKEFIFEENSVEDIEINDIFLNEKSWSKVKYRLIIESLLKQIVTEDYGFIFKNLPMGRFAKLIALNPLEIKNYQYMTNMIREYLKNENSQLPLSIAIFGPPYSGKTFIMTQLIDSIVIKYATRKLEFDCGLFNEPSDLVFALHQIHNIELSGKVPVVFFKNFDYDFNDTKWGGLKYFLEPMQGTFKEGNELKNIKKSIFIFESGTSYDFKGFTHDYSSEISNQQHASDEIVDFKKARGYDFISGLHGYIDIFGINKHIDDDNFYILRRAIFLRYILERKAEQLLDSKKHINIDSGVLKAFLLVPQYKHGIKSMESIIDMSMLQGRKKYEQSALPPENQLNMHVDSEIFLKIILNNVLFNQSMEKLAIQIHEDYIKYQKGNKEPDDPTMRPWDKLNESLKKSNYQQALDIIYKLRRIDMMPFVEEHKELVKFTNEEIEIMAEMEHEQWNEERFDEGWKLGPRDPENKISPYLVHWNDLPDNIKEYDRDAVKNIPELLASVGFKMYKLEYGNF